MSKTQIAVPEDLKGLDDDALEDLSGKIKEAAEGLADAAATDDEALAEVERLVEDFQRVEDEKAARVARREERAERAAAALTKFQGGETDGDEPEAEVDPVEEPEAEVEPIAAAVEVEPEVEPEVEEPAVEEPVAAAVEEAVAAAVESPAEAAAEAPTPVEAPAETIVSAPVEAADMSETDDALAPRVEGAAGAGFLASNAAPGVREGTPLDRAALAKAIVTRRHGMGRVSAGTNERIVLATAEADLGFQVGNGEEANFAVLEALTKQHRESVRQDTALVAAGGVCAPLEPSYDFFRLAEPINPVEGSLPVAEAPRGGIRFITPPDFRDAAGGVRVTTEAQDAAGYTTLPEPLDGPTAPKPCVRVECPPVEECRVDAVSQCVTFGNLNYRVFPEQVEAFLDDLAVIFTETKEIFYLDAIDAASTAVTFSPDYSAVRGLTYTLLAAAANYRRRHHMSPEAVLSLYLPSWVVEFVKVDLINDHSMGLGFLGAGIAEVNQVFASMNLDMTWYYDSATGAGQAFNGAQAEGDLNQFPSNVVAYLFAPGTFVRLNAGTLDLGIVRDSVLNGTNDLQIFSEEWIQVCQVGIESLRLEIALCPDGTAPEPVVPLSCAGASA